jgi:phage terminase large subunit GpA-like protein
MRMSSRVYKTIGSMICDAADLFRPPERLTPSQSMEKYVRLNNPGAYSGPYQNRTAPYMVEPVDTFVSPYYRELSFVGPAQAGKTEALILGAAAHSIKVDPMDLMIFSPTNTAARDFSIRRIDRMHRNSPEIGAMLIKRKDADNKFDKQYINGMLLTLSWPTPAELAGKPVPRVAFTDFDRMPDDIDGDGDPFGLGAKRTTSFGRFAMCLAESSPSRGVTDLNWIRTGAHEAPPCGGILGLYNRGDRRRWQWPCPNCRSYFEGNFKMLRWDDLPNIMDAADTARMICPNCDYEIHPDERFDMNLQGRWVKEGQRVTPEGVVVGTGVRSNMASFWLNGVAAAFVTWPRLVQIKLDAEAEHKRTGAETALQKFYNNDLGEPYIPKSFDSMRVPEHLMSRAEDWGSTMAAPTVPTDVRFLIATIDVQKNQFVVQVHGVSPGDPFDLTVIDRFDIQKSERVDEDGDKLWVKPGTYAEDWDLITEKVLTKTYQVQGTRSFMSLKLVGCDSGGREGVTANAYAYFRRLRKEGLGGRFHLVKGDHRPQMPRVQLSTPDASRGGLNLKAIARGDVPVYLFNTNEIKNMLDNRLDCMIPGKGQIRFPDWLPNWFYSELCAETRGEKGWEQPAHTRNEAWDLLYYCIGLCISPSIKAENIDWDRPPTWANEYSTNTMVSHNDELPSFANRRAEKYDFARLGRELA